MKKIKFENLKTNRVYQLTFFAGTFTGILVWIDDDTTVVDTKYNIKDEAELIALNTCNLNNDKIFLVNAIPVSKDYKTLESKKLIDYRYGPQEPEDENAFDEQYEKYDCKWLKPGLVYSLLVDDEWIKGKVEEICTERANDRTYVYFEREYMNPDLSRLDSILLTKIKDYKLEPEVPVCKRGTWIEILEKSLVGKIYD